MKSKYILPIILYSLLAVKPNIQAQSDTSYSFMAAGHAYGAHEGGNLGLHPAFLNSLNAGFDTTTAFVVFTGDIVNESTTESWQQVENELSAYPFDYYYAMGNHDDNEAGYQEFQDKFGASFYRFYHQSDLFIILNSVISGRSISQDQITFLRNELDLSGDTVKNVFIFFHEILWNSDEKYSGVRSNSRSRYSQIKDYSNYWDEIHPLLLERPGKKFFIISGDVGGNPDAIAAFYDTWENVTLISSGMGEVADENYLQVYVKNRDSVSFELIALNPEINLHDIEYYSVPSSPGNISGPAAVYRNSSGIEYWVEEVFNADSYYWELPEGVSGSSNTSSLILDFGNDFRGGTLSVSAGKDGFGKGSASSILIEEDLTDIHRLYSGNPSVNLSCSDDGDFFRIRVNGMNEDELYFKIYDISGRLLDTGIIKSFGESTEIQINKNRFPKAMMIISVFDGNRRNGTHIRLMNTDSF